MIYVAVVDGRRFYHEVTGRKNLFIQEAIAKQTVEWAGIKTDRNQPKSVSVEILSVSFAKGVMTEKHDCYYTVFPPFDEMDQSEYDSRIKTALDRLPEDLRRPIHLHACEFGKDRARILLMVEKLVDRITREQA